MQAVGCRCPPLPGPPSPSRPGSSWLQLAPHVPCRHLGRFPDKGGFIRLQCQGSPGEVCKSAPTRADQPCREEAAPTIYPAPLTKQPLPWDSTISQGSVTSVSIPSCSSPPLQHQSFFSPDSLSTWPLILSPSSPSPYVRACPAPLTPLLSPTTIRLQVESQSG